MKKSVVRKSVVRVPENSIYYPNFLPDGYVFHKASGSDTAKTIIFSCEEKANIIFYQMELTSTIQLDTEGADIMDIEIDGERGLLIEKGDGKTVSWYNYEKSFVLYAEVDRETIIKMVNHMRKISK